MSAMPAVPAVVVPDHQAIAQRDRPVLVPGNDLRAGEARAARAMPLMVPLMVPPVVPAMVPNSMVRHSVVPNPMVGAMVHDAMVHRSGLRDTATREIGRRKARADHESSRKSRGKQQTLHGCFPVLLSAERKAQPFFLASPRCSVGLARNHYKPTMKCAQIIRDRPRMTGLNSG